MTNEYKPWESEGITELEYCKRNYIQARQDLRLVSDKIQAIITKRRCSDGGCIWGRQNRRGQHTNGGCQSLKFNKVELNREIQALAKEIYDLADEVDDKL